MALCILREHANTLRDKLITGELDANELYGMSSEARQAKLAEFLPQGVAKQVNSDFETKLILKNQQRGLQNWVNRQVDLTEPAKRDLLSRVQRMGAILDQTDQEQFLSDLAETKLGARVTAEQANELSRLAKDVEMQQPGTMEYGYARADFDQYMEDIINPTNKSGLGDSLKAAGKDLKKSPLKIIEYAGGIAKSIKAALDNSALFRQGLKTLFTNPKQWANNALKSFRYITDTFGGKDVMREIRASMYADIDFDLAQKAKVALGVDDAIPSSLQEKIPLFGKLFQASDNAFRGFLFKTRFDVFKKYLNLARDAGIEVNDKQFLQQLGSLVNSQTGRGSLGSLEPIGNTVNNVFFSPRFVASQLDTFLHPITGARGIKNGLTDFSKGTNFIRKQAIKSLAKTLTGIGSILAISKTLQPDSVQSDPRSSDFGKIRIGDTRFDVTGGLASLVSLIARVSTSSTMDSKGRVVDLNTGKFGSKTTMDILQNYAQNKLSPIASVINDVAIRHQTFDGSKPTFQNEVSNFITPLPVSNFIESLQNENSANIVATTIADFLGIATNTYSPKKK